MSRSHTSVGTWSQYYRPGSAARRISHMYVRAASFTSMALDEFDASLFRCHTSAGTIDCYYSFEECCAASVQLVYTLGNVQYLCGFWPGYTLSVDAILFRHDRICETERDMPLHAAQSTCTCHQGIFLVSLAALSVRLRS